MDVHVEGDEKGGGVCVPPYSKIHLAVVPDEPAPHHVDFLVWRLRIFLLPEDLYPEVGPGEMLQAVLPEVDVP